MTTIVDLTDQELAELKTLTNQADAVADLMLADTCMPSSSFLAERLMAERWAFASAYGEHFSATNFSAKLPL